MAFEAEAFGKGGHVNSTAPERSGRKVGLQLRLTLFASVPVLIVMVLVGWLVQDIYAQVTFDENRERAAALLESFAVPSSIQVSTHDLEGLDANMIQMAQAGERLYGLLHVAMLDHRGKLLAQAYARDKDGIVRVPTTEVPHYPFFEEVVKVPYGMWKRRHLSNGRPILQVAVPAVSGLRWGTLVGHFDLTKHRERVASTRWAMVWITLCISLSMALAILYGLWKMVVQPVQVLVAATSSIRRGDLTARVRVSRSDELGELGGAFNDMAHELEDYTGHLEEKVEVRTRALHQKNTELGEVNRKLEDAVSKLDRLARTDRLTGAFNRGHIMEVLEAEIERTRRSDVAFSFIILDVDFFKKFNDTFGHQAGDYVLVETVKRLDSALRSTDVLGRYGGEEFVAILPDTNLEGALSVAENLRRVISQTPFTSSEGRNLGTVTVSLGVATFPDHGSNGRHLVRSADRALYSAKERGRDCVVCGE